ncbi:MAG: transcriptional regulator, LuxR family, partial [Actinomycetia bacterium]|nr:transcriptional regulator, LuxR family [Actinomycetes bacterium]
AEIGMLQAALAALERGAGGLLQVVGEPGIGKTRLLAATRDLATARGMRVVSGRSAEFEGRMPFQVLVEALHGYGDGVPPDELVPPGVADVLYAAIPELLAPDPAATSGTAEADGGYDIDRFRLFQALRQLLLAMAARPLVMLLDDVHWADPASIDFLDFLSRRPIPAALLVVVAHRDRQAPPRLSYALARNTDHGAVTRIELGPLTRAEAAELIGAQPGSRRAAELYARSEGNPLYLLTLDRNEGHGLPRTLRDLRIGHNRHERSGRLESLILGEIMAMSPGESTVASTAAVLGDPFSPEVLTEVVAGLGSKDAPRTAQEVEVALAALMDRDLIRPLAEGPALAFRHPLVRRAVYDHTAPAWRVGVHRQALTLLAANGAPAAELGMHIEHCARVFSAEQVDILIQAGYESMSTSPLTAAHWFQVALRLLPMTSEFAASRRQTEYLLARALGLGGRFEESRHLLHGLLHADQSGDVVNRGEAVVLCAHVEQRLGRYPEAMALLRAEVARLGPAPSPERIGLCLELGLTALLANDYPAARADISWAREAARAAGDVLGEATALAFGAFGEICVGHAADARAAADTASAMVDGLPDSAVAGEREALCMLGWAEVLLERFADAERHLARGRDIIGRTGQSHGLPHVLLGQALVDMFTGSMLQALEHAEQAEDAAHLVGSDHLLGIALAVKSPICVSRSRPGEGGEALAATRRATTLFTGSAADSWWARNALMLRGHAEFSNGDPHLCVEFAIMAGGPDLRLLGMPLIPQYAEVLVGALVTLGDVRRAAEFAELASDVAERLNLPGQRGHAARARGLLAAIHGDHEAAVTEFAAAEAGFAAAGKVLEHAWTAVFARRSLARLGRADEAAAALRRSAEQAAACGGLWVLAEVEQALAQLSGTADAKRVPHRERAAPAPPASVLSILTDRERQVTELAGAGHSNRQIATRLRLSERTVEAHLANVYRKLGVASRVMLARLVTREQAE